MSLFFHADLLVLLIGVDTTRAGMSLGAVCVCRCSLYPIATHRQIASGASYAAIAGALVYSRYKAAAKSRVGMNRHSER